MSQLTTSKPVHQQSDFISGETEAQRGGSALTKKQMKDFTLDDWT